jgi:hypothetical protein
LDIYSTAAVVWLNRFTLHHVAVDQDANRISAVTAKTVTLHQYPSGIILKNVIENARTHSRVASLSSAVYPNSPAVSKERVARDQYFCNHKPVIASLNDDCVVISKVDER